MCKTSGVKAVTVRYSFVFESTKSAEFAINLSHVLAPRPPRLGSSQWERDPLSESSVVLEATLRAWPGHDGLYCMGLSEVRNGLERFAEAVARSALHADHDRVPP
jgi:hypothetical protein